MRQLEGKVVVVTGSTRGLGLAIAQACAKEGARVMISSRSPAAVEQVVTSLKAGGAEVTGMACDVSSFEQVEALAARTVEKFGQMDVWFNNAGVAPPYGPAVHVPVGAMVQTVQTNVLGTYYGSIVAMRHFLVCGAGKLVNILGRGDRGSGVPMQSGYAASKAWVRSFTQALAEEYKQSGVGVFAFNPGMMSTDFLTDVEAVEGFQSRLKVMPTIIRMWATPPEVPARRAVWLASAATDGRTGLEIHEMNVLRMAFGALREGIGRLTRRTPEQPITIIQVPAAIAVPARDAADQHPRRSR